MAWVAGGELHPHLSEKPPPPAQPAWPAPSSDDFNPKEHIWDGTQWWTRDRQYWWTGKRWQSVSDDEPDPLEADQPINPALAPKAKHGPGLWIGFFGAIAGNVLLLILLSAVGNALFNVIGDAAFTVQGLAPWILNIGALIAFAVWPRGRRIALGMLLAYGVALALGLVAAIILAVVCGSGSVP